METVKDKLRRTNPEIIWMTVEYIIDIWVIITTIVNVLNLQEITSLHSVFMKPTFFGASLLTLLLLQYGLIRSNKGNKILNKIRPYAMALAAADVVSICNLSLCFMLLLLIGYFLVSGFSRKCPPREAALTLLLACAGIEIYSIVLLMQEKSSYAGVEAFLKSPWPDVLLAGAAFLYHITVHTVSTEDGENVQSKRNTLWSKIKFPVILQNFSSWCRTESIRLTRWIGSAICIISLGLFLYFVISVGIGAQKISQNTEEVYLLEHCEDPSLVLTLEEDEDTGEYAFSFKKYMGTNNQKVHLHDAGNGMYQLIFLSPESAIGVKSNQTIPYADLDAYSSSQYWIKEFHDSEPNQCKFICSYEVPLCYNKLYKENYGLYIGIYNDDCEFFILEKTVRDEFITRMAAIHRDEFMPTILMESCSALLGKWTSILFILIIAAFFGIIYLRRILGDKLAVLYALLFAYMLAYGAVSAMALLFLAIVLQCGCNYYRRSLKHLEKEGLVH